MARLKALLDEDGVEYIERVFMTSVADLGPNPFVSRSMHVVIIHANMTSQSHSKQSKKYS